MAAGEEDTTATDVGGASREVEKLSTSQSMENSTLDGSPSEADDGRTAPLHSKLMVPESDGSLGVGAEEDLAKEVETMRDAPTESEAGGSPADQVVEPSEEATLEGGEEMSAMVAAAVISPMKEEGGTDMSVRSPSPCEQMSTASLAYALDESMDAVDGERREGSADTSAAEEIALPNTPDEEDKESAGSLLQLKEDGSVSAAASSASDDNQTAQKIGELRTLQSQDSSGSKPSSILDELAGAVTQAETQEDVLSEMLSDAGESKCTFTSTAPVINLTNLGGEEQDEKLLALGALAQAANADGQSEVAVDAPNANVLTAEDGAPLHTATDEDATEIEGYQKAAKSTISIGSGADASAHAKRLLGRISPINTALPSGGRDSSPSSSPKVPISPSSVYSAPSLLDKQRLNQRLKQRLAKRNQMQGSSGSPTKDEPPSLQSQRRSPRETRLQAAIRQNRLAKANAKSDISDGDNSDILSKYSSDPGCADMSEMKFPDTVTFSDGDDDGPSQLSIHTKVDSRDQRSAYRKCVSEVGASLSLSTRAARSKLSRHHHAHHHQIGILQADGIVYDDALLLRLARQARYGKLRGKMSGATADSATTNTLGANDKRQFNDVKIHVYDLLTNDAMMEIPHLNCNFPIGQCFKVVNDGCHVLGTGAYHVGVEVNGIEYAFGANNIIGLSGIFTCVPKESPGYEYRETLDFGKQYTTKRTWIRIPKAGGGASYQTISAALGDSADSSDNHGNQTSTPVDPGAPSKEYKKLFSFREIETYADGHAIIHSMAREYMGTDYDLLRKNCCTFARDVCMRLGVKEEDIPEWFHNAAKAGADAEDAITSMEFSVRNVLNCAEGLDPLDMECYNHGYEVIPEPENGVVRVVESPAMRAPRERRPICEADFAANESVPDETASWTY